MSVLWQLRKSSTGKCKAALGKHGSVSAGSVCSRSFVTTLIEL